MHKEFILVNYNTLLHVSTLLAHLQGETFRCRYTMLHYTVKRKCAVDCALRHLWRRELFCSLGLHRTFLDSIQFPPKKISESDPKLGHNRRFSH
jgi:hypothetical protein